MYVLTSRSFMAQHNGQRSKASRGRRLGALAATLLLMVIFSGCAPAVVRLATASETLSEPGMALAGEQASTEEVIKVDVVDNPHRFVVGEAPVHEDGMPAYGNILITQGYIYPHGTLNGSNGVLPNGEPEFPDKVIGKWFCRGFRVRLLMAFHETVSNGIRNNSSQ